MKPIAAILIGALLTVFARPMATGANKAKQDRLAKLKAGDEEAFFEERRSLEAYPVKAVWFRVFGIVLIAYGAAFLFLGH